MAASERKRRPPARRVRAVLDVLGQLYPDPRTELRHDNPWQLLMATMLSAQCTDKRVNLITPRLFAVYPDVAALAAAPVEAVEDLIRDCGLFRTKARNLVRACQVLLREHGGEVPRDAEALQALPGVGRKTANVVLANAFGVDAIAVDTHVFRVSHRLGWSDAKDPAGTERDLMAVIPRRYWRDAHHWLILHGRRVCRAVRPSCTACALARWCPRRGVAPEASGSGVARPVRRKKEEAGDGVGAPVAGLRVNS